ncbi:glycoside hydrolase N-terminal domain-containing protein [Streptococcus oralis]|uniref:SIALI-17 repeat-containing surface protein n=1 Tax=Streptococcus oralis TaxID=1303 RepID=UPI0022846041|nr:SIALI-17 repeat-containing surface protein [Streptococcus oralis]MCY7072151.1 glycoside hydrolase N-terminal domain-containing protein [Streptococcus oralis]
MKKHFWEKSCRYSIRKLTVGTASVLLGAVFLVNHTVAADSVEVKQTEPTSVEAITKPDSEPKAAEATETTNPSLSESPVVSESKPAEETQTTNSQASEEAIVEAKENKEPEKADQPVTKQENYQLNYDQPTAPSYDGWEKQALPVGNGEMGAKVFGLIGEERIQYNEKTLWSGGPQPDSTDYNGGNYKDRYKVLAEIRKALEAGDRQKAKQLAEQNLVGPNNAQYGSYLAFGDIFMVFNNQKKGLDTVTDYHRRLDITEATTTTSYTQDGTTFKRETFSSYPDDVTVTHLTKKGNKTLDFTLWNSLTEDLLANGNYSWEYSNYKNGHVTTDANGILLKGTVKDNGLQFASYLGIKTDGKVTVQNETLTVTGASYATLYLSAKTNFAQNPKTNYRKDIDLEKTVKGIVEAAKAKDYETLKKDHIKDYQSLFNRVKLNLGGSKTAQTTKEALQSYNPSKGQKLEELFFQYGRYLLISSSRDKTDALPANLQGVWNAVDNPPWNADYHLNVNLQMNYWPAYMSNLAETAKPMINYIDDMRYYGRIAAKEYAGIESKDGQENGWLVHTQATPFGWTTPGWNYYWGWSPAANAWMMQNVYDYYKFTKDENYLKEKIYPMLKETAKFWNSFLHYDQASDRWVSSPSYSPEHGTITIGNTFDQSLVWQLFHDYMEVANHLKVDQDLVTEVKAKFDKLNPLHINKEGRIKEWYEEDSPQFTNEGIENNHRHVSHLVGLFPGTLFSKDQAEYLEAARATLNHRGDGGTGWSKANKINLWARLLDGNRAHRLLAEQLKYSTLENLWDTHAPFQIDGNFGATSGMAEMLLQSHTGYIAPLPALPDAWKDGQVSGLIARGNFEVSMKWKDKNLQSLSFLSNVGGDLVVDYPNIETSQVKINGKPVKATILKNNRIQLATQKGDVITFEHFPGRVTSLTAVRQNGVTAELTFNQVEGTTHYVIQRQVKDASGQTSATREFVTNQTHFIDRSLDPQHAYTYTVKAMLGELATQVSEQATVETYSELIDDRDSRIQYGAAFGNLADSELFGGTEKFADLSKGDYTDEDLTSTIPFTGVGIEIYGLKSSELGLATAKIDGKEVGELDFHTAGATEKGSLIGRFTGLSDRPHTLTLSVKREHKGRGSERSKISLDYFKILAGTGNSIEKIDDRDSRIQYGSQFKDWSDPELYGGTEKYADINNSDPSTASEAQATISFTGTGIRIFGLKSLALGRARVTLDGKEMSSLDFYTSGATEKRAFIGEFTNLTDGPHTLTLQVDPDSPEGRKKISLDSFDIIKAPAVGLDSPSIASLKENDKTISLSLPSGDWEAIAVTFPGVKDPLVLRKVDETHLVTSGDQTVLSVQDNQVQIPIPEETNRKAGNAIEAYTIQGNTTSSPIVAVFTKKDEKKVDEKQPTTSKGEEPAPTVEKPEYTDPIGTAGQEVPPTVEKPEYTEPIGTAGQEEAPTVEKPKYTKLIGTAGQEEAPTVEKPEYNDPIGTAGQEEPPTVTIPEYTEPIGTAGQEEAPTVTIPEYTEPIGTSGDQAAPTLSLPDYPVQVLKDKETGVEIIGGASDLEGISHVSSRRVLAQGLFGKTYDAYDLQLKNPTDHSLQPKGSVLVLLPISASVENIYYITPTKELQALDFTVQDGKVEFITNHFSTYAVVYQATGTSSNTEEKPSTSDAETLAHEAEQLSASPSLAKVGNHSPKEELPATGETSNPLLFIAGLSLALTATFMLNGRKDDSN